MLKSKYKRLKGSQILRQRLLLATLSHTPVLIEDIRTDETWPGLRPHEVSFLRLMEKICDDSFIEINETGTHNHDFHRCSILFLILSGCSLFFVSICI